MPMPRTFAFLALLAGLTGVAHAQGETTCARDVLVAQSMQRQALEQLEQADGDGAKNCRVWRRHVETMRRVASVYGRCLSGSDRVERLAQVQSSDREFSAAIKAHCKGL
ncbi:hypothetical protein [Methylobacterium sp. NEAU K]|uniref:hypothetical protein n=1 Tax=Methylobacterium sp. NEAU K TaxID=3064946 RepID=UPI002732478A|nr:hypothetical protein [Methylobacterium sp. NEAU K]MDP4005608.1 hypothetical protein [Methylobacterium sp. NEAU K]